MTKDDKLIAAVKLVNDAIASNIERLNAIASGSEQDPILVEGETTTDYYCQLMVDPKIVARIMLNYDYSTYRILEQDVPDEMWAELGEEFGLKTVSSVDL